MKKKAVGKPTKGRKPALAKTRVAPRDEDVFAEVVTLIQRARHRALQAVNTELVGSSTRPTGTTRKCHRW